MEVDGEVLGKLEGGDVEPTEGTGEGLEVDGEVLGTDDGSMVSPSDDSPIQKSKVSCNPNSPPL